ncbi:nitric oxide-sensing protein NosP [Rheinheimera sp.]|uniref:nitric oxide-sensing protein NosP n=1 Tax=Rheinheimera sp. TaxID=1869214 RepID=UPI003D2D76AC
MSCRSDLIVAAMSAAADARVAVAELAAQLLPAKPGFVLFFCSAEYDRSALEHAFAHFFAGVTLAGCTTAGEITPRGYDQGTICALGFSASHFQVAQACIQDLAAFDLLQAQQLVDGLLQHNQPQALPPTARPFVLTLLDGLSAQEEMVLLALEAALGNIAHFGGSAGDDNLLNATHIFVDGRFYQGAAAVIMLHTTLPFEVFSTHHVSALSDKLVVTAASADMRTVHELNAEPAALAYAAAIGCQVTDLNATVFALHPLAVRIGKDYYVRSIQRVHADNSLTFYCAVGQGAVLTTMQPQPILPDLQQRFAEIEQRIGEPLITIGCDCVLRRLESTERQTLQQASEFFRAHRVFGFNTYGEHFQGVHLNQTFTGVVIAQPAEG